MSLRSAVSCIAWGGYFAVIGAGSALLYRAVAEKSRETTGSEVNAINRRLDVHAEQIATLTKLAAKSADQ